MVPGVTYLNIVRRIDMVTKLFRNARIFTPIVKASPLQERSKDRLQSTKRGAMLVKDGHIAKIGNEGDVIASLSYKDVNEEQILWVHV